MNKANEKRMGNKNRKRMKDKLEVNEVEKEEEETHEELEILGRGFHSSACVINGR